MAAHSNNTGGQVQRPVRLYQPIASDLDPRLQESASRISLQAAALLQQGEFQRVIPLIEAALDADPACTEAIQLARFVERRLGVEYCARREAAFMERLATFYSGSTSASASHAGRAEMMKTASFHSAPKLMRWMMERISIEGRDSTGSLLPPPLSQPTDRQTDKPQVSFITPVFNRERSVKKTFYSVLSQTFPGWEIVFVDDASSDGSLKVLRQLQESHPDRRIRIEALPRNRGIGAVRNIGVGLAQGEFIALLDSDDTIAPRYLKLTLAALADCREAAWAAPLTIQYGNVNRLFGFERFDLTALLQRNLFNITNLMRREMFLELGGMREEMTSGLVDWDFWIRASLKGYRPVQVRTPLFFYHRHEHGVTGEVQDRRERWVRARTQILTGSPEVYYQPHETNTVLSRNDRNIPAGFLKPDGVLKASSRHNPLAHSQPDEPLPPPRQVRKSVKRVLFVCHDFPPHRVAGAQMYALRLAKQLSQRGLEVEVLHPVMRGELPPDYLIREQEWEGIRVFKLPKEPHPEHKKVWNQRVEQTVLQFLKERGYDLVHVHGLGQLSTAPIFAAKQAGLPVAMTLHDFWLLCDQWHMVDYKGDPCSGPESPGKCAECCLARLGMVKSDAQFVEAIKYQTGRRKRFLDAFTAVDIAMAPSRFFAERFASFGMKGVAYHPLGLEPVETREKPPRLQPVFGYFGQIIYRKGVDLLPETFGDPRLGQTQLLVYGKANEQPYGDRVIQALNRLPNVQFKGAYRPDGLPDLYAGIDVALLPTRMDNYPLTVLEALQQRTPVIAARVGGVPELIQEGINGMLFEPGSVEDIRRATLAFVDDPQLAARMRDRIKPVTDIKEDVNATLEVYRQL